MTPSGPVDATVALPGSKSITNRALVCAALADGPSRLTGALIADDTEAMIVALRACGVSIAVRGDVIVVDGGGLGGDEVSIDARQSGTTSRFLLPALATDGVRRRVDGDDQLRARPMGPSFAALRAMGAEVTAEVAPDALPASVRGPMSGGSISLPGDVSSQFLSGLLLAGPAMAAGLTASVSTTLVSRHYVDMTASVMRAFGAGVTPVDDQTWRVDAGGYHGTDYAIEPDASAASYAWAMALIAGGAVTVTGLSRAALQGDVGVVDVFAAMGADVRWDDDAITVAAGDGLVGIDVDMAQISDTVQTVAVVAAFASSPTRIRNVDFIRHKETDRIAAPVAELQRAGINASATDDGILIEPGPISPAIIETYRDHRMAMAFALLGLGASGIAIRDPNCVAKTFPGYWALLDAVQGHTLPPARSV